jgi:hypothetical protein
MNSEEELFEKYLRRELTDLEAQRLKDVLDRPGGTRRFVAFVQEWTLVGEVSRRLEAARRPDPGPAVLRPGTPRSGLRYLRAVRRSRLARRTAWLGFWIGGIAAAGLLAALWAVRPAESRRVAETPAPTAQAPKPAFEKRVEPSAPALPVAPVPIPDSPSVPASPKAPRPELPARADPPEPEPSEPLSPRPPAPRATVTAPAVARVDEMRGEVTLAGPGEPSPPA